jgi:hypothetical protein
MFIPERQLWLNQKAPSRRRQNPTTLVASLLNKSGPPSWQIEKKTTGEKKKQSKGEKKTSGGWKKQSKSEKKTSGGG